MFQEAVKLLSKPGAWSGFVDEERMGAYQDVVLEVLASEGMSMLVNTFIESSGMTRNSLERREYSVRALAGEQGRLREAWRYVRDLEFQDDMVQGEELEVIEDGEMDVDGSEERAEKQAEAVHDERNRLLAVILDAILIRKSLCAFTSSARPYSVLLSAHPNKSALQALVKLPMDSYEQKFLTSYLLNTTSSLSATSFSLLHDLLTLRLCARGQHALAIELDRQVAERIRERPELAVGSEVRVDVQEMVKLLPEVQRKMLLVERDVGNAEEEKARPEATKEPVEQASSPVARPALARIASYTRPSFAPLSASTQLRQSSNPRNAIYEALLRPPSLSSLPSDAMSATANNSQRFVASDHAAASSRRQLNTSTRLTASTRIPFGGQQTQFPSSPFNVPPRVPVGYAMSGLMHSAGYTDISMDDREEAAEDGSITPREERSISPESGHRDGAVEEGEREETPVAREPVEQSEAGEDRESHASGEISQRTRDDAMDVENQRENRQDSSVEQRPSKTSRGKRTRQQPKRSASPPKTRAIAKTPARTRKQRQDSPDAQPAPESSTDHRDADEDHAIPGAFPSSSKMKRKLRSSAQFETEEQPEQESQQPRAKRSRKGVAGAEAARRATRSQSVASQATTEADQEAMTPTKPDSDAVRRRPQRRSARLSESTAPSSPAKSVTSEVGSVTGTGRRTRGSAAKEMGTTPRRAAPATRGVRTRRQAAALEEEDEE
jgi:hypothetical protein